MKFLLDVCASSRSLRRILTDLGHEVLSVVEIDRRAEDSAILALAHQEEESSSQKTKILASCFLYGAYLMRLSFASSGCA